MRVVLPSTELRPHFEASARRASQECLRRSREGKSTMLQLDLASVMAFYDIATTGSQYGKAFVPSLVRGTEVLGFMILQEMFMPKIDNGMVSTQPYAFLWAAYKHSTDSKGRAVGSQWNRQIMGAVIEWAKARNFVGILANCDPSFPHRAFEQYGFKVHHTVIGMEL